MLEKKVIEEKPFFTQEDLDRIKQYFADEETQGTERIYADAGIDASIQEERKASLGQDFVLGEVEKGTKSGYRPDPMIVQLVEALRKSRRYKKI